MDIVEMLDQSKERLGIASDYALAKELGIRQSRIDGYRKGREHPDTYVCFKLAEILNISPSKVVAVVEAKTQKNPAKSLYFQQFFTIAALWITLGLMLPNLDGSLGSAYADGNIKNNLINQHKGSLCEVAKGFIRRLKNWLKHAIFGHICPILYV